MEEQHAIESEIILEHTFLPLAYIRHGLIVRVNRAFEQLFGQSRTEFVGQNWEAFRLSVFAGEMDICVEGVSHCLRLRNGKGHFFWASLKGNALDEENPDQGAVWSIQDVTAQKHAADALQLAKSEADKATRAKGEFLANMSHEIRTPMNVILGMTGLALEDEMGEQQRSYLENVKESANSLLALINDILDYSKVESGHLNLEQKGFDFAELVHGVVGNFEHIAQEKGLYLKSEIEVLTDRLPAGDALRLRQILINLVNNALKFTGVGGVTIVASLVERGGEKLEATFRVHDTGIGIAQESQELIFSSFSQADSSTSRKYGGTGLGLAICRQLVELMQGTLDLESRPGVGSVFSFTVSFDEQSRCGDDLVSCGGSDTPGACTCRNPMAILVADDHPGNRQLAQAILEKEGHQVTLAENGLQVLEELAVTVFDHILMDIQMPVIDGLEATKYIRQIEGGADVAELGLTEPESLKGNLQGKHLQIIAMTANAMPEEKERCLAAGLDHYMTKPYEKETLVNLLAQGQHDAESAQPEMNGCSDKVGTGYGLKKVSRQQVCQNVAEAFEMDEETADKVVDTYAKSLSEDFSGLTLALADRNFQDLEHHSHAIRGAFLNLGLKEFAAAAKDMEERAARHDDDGLKEMVAVMQKNLQSYLLEQEAGGKTV